MRVPPLGYGPDLYLRLGVAHTAALEADTQTRDLVEPMRAANELILQTATRRDQARELVVARLALRERADYEADRVIRRLDAEAFMLAGRDRAKSPYRELFPAGVTKVVTGPLAEEIQEMKTLAGRLGGELAKYADPLAQARGRLEEAVGAHAEAVRAEAAAGADLELAKIDWQRQYRASYGRLLALFGDRRQTESYFLALSSGHARDDGDG